MSRRAYYDRHVSPYSSSPSRGAPIIKDEDYVYLTQDDIVDPPAGFWSNSDSYGYSARSSADRSSNGRYPRGRGNEPPDVLFVRLRNERVELEFPAFTVAEGLLKIGVIRKYAADRFRVDDLRRVKLIYKNKTLRNDEMPARDAGLKQNSELTCIITAEPTYDSESSSDERRTGAQVNVDGTILHPPSKRDKNKAERDARDHGSSMWNNATSATQASTSTLTPTSTSTSAAQATITPSTTPAPGPPFTPPSGPRTPREKLDDLTTLFNTNYRHLCEAFLANPPSDPKVRATEHTKLSETILAQVLLKLDDVQTDGNEELRRIRRSAVQDVQAVLNRLDKLAGKAK